MTLPGQAARRDGDSNAHRSASRKIYVTDEVIRKIADQLLGIDTCKGELNVVSLVDDAGASTGDVSDQARSAAVWRDSGLCVSRAARAVPRMSRTVL